MTITPAGAGVFPTSSALARLTGLSAIGFSALYFLSDLLELAAGGFTPGQLVITYIAEAAIPVFVLGLYAVQRPRIGTLGLIGAIGYAYAYVFFTGTVLLALVNDTADWDVLVADLGPWITVHGVLMVVAGTAFGIAVVTAGVLPRWTGLTLIAGVVLVAASSMLPDLAQTASAGVRDLGFAAMGFCVLRPGRGILSSHQGISSPAEAAEAAEAVEV